MKLKSDAEEYSGDPDKYMRNMWKKIFIDADEIGAGNVFHLTDCVLVFETFDFCDPELNSKLPK